jgi:hypothetical protein
MTADKIYEFTLDDIQEIGHMVVEDLDELLQAYTQLDNRMDKDHEKFYLRCFVIPIQDKEE